MRRATLAAIVLLAGCTAGPDYTPPQAKLPEDWAAALPPGATTATDDATLAQWWTAFGDPELDQLVAAAVEGNRDLASAAARVREARALREEAAAGGRPQLDFNASATRSRRSGNALFSGTSGSSGGSGTGSNGVTIPLISNLFSLGFDASWELDLFGGVRRSVEAAEADLVAAQEDQHAVTVSLLGEVARNWIDARAALRRLAIAREALASQQDTADLTRSRRDAGMADDLDVSRAESLVAGTRATIPAFEEAYARATHQLDVLLGRQPGAAQALLGSRDDVPPPPPQVPVGMPSDLLRRRPDVRRAERQLAAASARIGVAVADEYPKFSLTGGIGRSSLHTNDLLDSSSRTWSLGAGLDWPVWHGGQLSAQAEAADARAEQALHAWESTVLVSLQESHDALVAYGREQERRTSLQEAAVAQRRAADLARQRNQAGLSDFLVVLDAERSELAAEDLLALSEAALADDAVALYKALGGGWDAPPPSAPGGGGGAAR